MIVATVTRICSDCARPFTLPRSRGRYPRRCPACTNTEPIARRLLRVALRRLPAALAPRVQRGSLGWAVVVDAPWHDEPTPLRDEIDIAWIAVELDNDTKAERRARRNDAHKEAA